MGRNDTDLDYDIGMIMTITYHVIDNEGKTWGIHWKKSEAEKQIDKLNANPKTNHLSFSIHTVEKED